MPVLFALGTRLRTACGNQMMTVPAMQMAAMNVCAAVLTSVDPSPVPEFAEHALDPMALAVVAGVVRDRHLSVGL